ncbi:unnamed protein product [Hydatigera taeniaeformis]|uniref:IRS-type PTB domain-containing protein n=1 Tax=Hydatigena taeniaeformis TaxID=6205 RepID=A0A0R3WM84_HYDTA|nr:unnamed protein product [Hydatigera taeniaeformis]
MSVAVTHTPRFFSRNGCSGLKGPPEFTCSAVLLERKFIASHGPPPHIDAERLARTITVQKGTQRDFNVCVFRDRLLFHAMSRGPDLSEISFDDVVQIEVLSNKQNILFILCGQRGVGCYYFFKIIEYGMANRIKELTSLVNPNLMHGREGCGSSMNNCLRYRMYERHPLKENVYAYDNPRIERDFSAPPSVFSEDSSATSTFSLYRQNSFIGWEGCRRNRVADYGRSFRSKQASLNRSSSRSRSRTPRKGNKTLYIKAQGVPNRRKASSVKRKRQPLVVLEDNRPRSKPISRPATHNDKRKRDPRFATAPQKQRRSGSNYKRAQTVRRTYDTKNKCESSESTYDLADEVEIDPHPYPHNSRLRNVDYQVEEMDEYDWESMDSWDLGESRSFRRFQGVTFNVPHPHGRQPKQYDYGNDEESNSSVDSLYLEREMEYGNEFPQHHTNYLPELQEKFKQFNLK